MLTKGTSIERAVWGGSRAQSLPQMKSKRQSARHKHVCHPQELAGTCRLIRVFLSLLLCKWDQDGGTERAWTDTHLYFIGRDVTVALDWYCSSRDEGRGRRKREREKQVFRGTRRLGEGVVWEVNLEQISIVTEQEGQNTWSCYREWIRRGFTQQAKGQPVKGIKKKKKKMTAQKMAQGKIK